MTKKDPTIQRLLIQLVLNRHGWIVVDNWEADEFAIGIASKADPRRIVYISTFDKAVDRYDYECEVPTGFNETDFESTDRDQDVTYEQLVAALQKHLGPHKK